MSKKVQILDQVEELPPSAKPIRSSTFDTTESKGEQIEKLDKQDRSTSVLKRAESRNSANIDHGAESKSRPDSPVSENYSTAIGPEHETRTSSYRHGSQSRRHSTRPDTHRSNSKADKGVLFNTKHNSGSDPVANSETLLHEITQYRVKIDELERECSKKEKANRKLRREAVDLAEDNEDMQDQLEEQDSQIRRMQEQYLMELDGKGFLRAEDDDTVRQKIQNCMNKCRHWARNYAVPTRKHIRETDKPLAENLFRSNVVPDELASPYGLFSSTYASTVPGIFLNAELTKFLVEWILRQPFSCLTDKLVLKQDPSSELVRVFQALDLVYQNAQMNGDPSMAHAWRSQTLRMVDPPEQESRTQYKGNLQRKEQYYGDAALVFDSGPARVLYSQCDTSQRQKELLDIMRTAGALFGALWKQKVYIAAWGLEKFQKMPFSIASNEMIAHPALGLEEGDTRMDGLPVQMVVQPAIVAFGNEDGKNYDEYKVWAKAVVWLS